MKWKRKPQENEGSYTFSGQFIVTRNVLSKIPPEEILSIYLDIQQFVTEKGSVDYLQVYINDSGEKLFLIDELSHEMLESGQFDPADNHCTLLFSWEY